MRGGGHYTKIVGINPFGNTNGESFNFLLKDWIHFAESLAKEFPQILFILTTYEANSTKLEINYLQNLKIFCNNEDILNLVELVSRLNLLVSVNTGNVHIADNLRVPTLEVSRKERHLAMWRGGSYGGEYDDICLPRHWKRQYGYYLEKFYEQTKSKIQQLSQE